MENDDQYIYSLREIIMILDNYYYGTHVKSSELRTFDYQTQDKSSFEDKVIEKTDVQRILEKLKPRERFVLQLLGRRYQLWETADRMHIPEKHLEGFLRNISFKVKDLQLGA